MSRTLLIFLILFLLQSCAPRIPREQTFDCPPPPPQIPLTTSVSSIPKDPSIRKGTLENGITYYIRQNKKPENRAELRMALKAGSMQEDPDQLGLAHFTEHMAFNGSTHFSKNELVNYLESVGSRFGPDLNAYTSFDETVYQLQVRTDEKDHFEKGMLILRDWADGISFEDQEIDKERGVVMGEWRSRLSPDQRMQQQYLPVIYYKSRYADRLPIGDPEIIKNAPYDAARRFYKDWYRPDLMAILVVGDVNVDSVEMKIKNQFGSILPATNPRQKEPVTFPVHEETFARVVTDPEATSSTIQVIYKHTFHPVTNILDYRERLVHSLYNRMMAKRLTEFSRFADPPFIFGNTGYSQDVGTLANYSSFAVTEAKNIKRAYQTLLEENQRVLLHGFRQTELDREKAAVLRQAEQNVLEQDKQESSRIIQRMVNRFLDDIPIPDASQHLELYKSMMPTITVDEVSNLANEWITDRNKVILITAPEKDKPLLPDSVELIRIMQQVSRTVPTPYEDVDVSAPIIQGDFKSTAVLNKTHDTENNIYHWEFANGVHVSAKPTDFKNDEIIMNAYSIGGHSLYADDKYPSARSVSSVIQASGVGPYNATALEKKLSGLRVNVTPFVFERFEGMSGSSSVADLETMMQLVYAWTTAYRRDSVALQAYVNRERSMYSNLLSNPQNWFSDKVTKITTQNHPRRGFATPESYSQVDLDEILKIYQDRFKDVSDMHFFFVGNFDPDKLQELTSRYLGALPGGGRKEMWKDVGDRMPSGVIDSLFHKGQAPKSLVQIIYHGDDRFNQDTGYVLQSLVDLARIKLRESLREEQGGVYGVSISGGQSQQPIQQYSIRISFNAEPARTEELAKLAKDVIQKLKSDVDPLDIKKVTEAQRQGRVKDLQQNQFWMNAFVNGWMNGLTVDEQVDTQILDRRIRQLNPEVLKRAARKYFNNKEVISVIMFPGKS